MKKIFYLVMIIAMLLFAGCTGQCIKLEGTYKEWGGGLTWCKDAQLSQDAKRDVLTAPNGEAAILLPEKELKLINDQLEKVIPQMPSAKSLDISPIQQYKVIMDKLQQR